MIKNENNGDSISVIAQFFCGNRTETQIKRDWIDHFLRGQLSRELYGPEDIQDAVRKAVRIPGSDSIVIVYDGTQEDRYVQEVLPGILARDGADYLKHWREDMKQYVSCEIPEIGFRIHTRCIACRMDENGVLQSLKEEDHAKVIRYLPA